MSIRSGGFSLGFGQPGSVASSAAWPGIRRWIASGVCALLQAVPMIGQTVTRAVPDRVVPADGAADRTRPAARACCPC